MTQLTDRDLFELAAPLRQVESVTRPAEGPHRPVRIPEIVRLAAAIPVLAILLFAAFMLMSLRHQPKPAGQPTSVVPGVPPAGVPYSTPENDGKLVLQISPAVGPGWNIFADGRVIGNGDLIPKGENPLHMANSQQWLTPQGVQLLRSRILAIARPVGIFTRQDHGFTRQAYVKQGLSDWYQVRIGHHLRNTQVVGTGLSESDPPATPAQIHALEQINTLINRLPPSAWKDRTIRPYIPSHFCVAWDRAAPDPDKLPSPAKELLAHLLPSWARTASGTLTTDQARALFIAFADAGVKLVSSGPGQAAWKVPTAQHDPRYTILGFGPGIPNGGCGP